MIAVDVTTGEATAVAGMPGVSGQSDGTGAKAQFNGPTGIRADGMGHLYVADEQNHAIREIDLATGRVSTIAGPPGTPGSDDGIGAAARFSFPSSVAVDNAGELFVADSFNNAVRRIDTETGAVKTVIGNHVPGVRLGVLPGQVSPQTVALTATGGLVVSSENAVLLAH